MVSVIDDHCEVLIVTYVSAACSLILAFQLLARYFWQIRDRGIIVGARELAQLELERHYETPPTCTS